MYRSHSSMLLNQDGLLALELLTVATANCVCVSECD